MTNRHSGRLVQMQGGYRAWYAHITLSMLALAGLAAIKTHVAKGDQTCAIAT